MDIGESGISKDFIQSIYLVNNMVIVYYKIPKLNTVMR